jgi:26S proteasome regulatory subunit N7
VAALAAYDALPPKGLSTGQRIDVVMAKARLALAHSDWALSRTLLREAKELNEKGGDWDRRNRLKVYEATLAVVERGACPRVGVVGWC